MPYIPSKKTDNKSTDREVLDIAVEALAKKAASEITNNLSLIEVYRRLFLKVVVSFIQLSEETKEIFKNSEESELARAIYEIGKSYDYEGAYLGELNYSITRFIQRVPALKAESGQWKQEFRYWLYAATVEALVCVADKTLNLGRGIGGVFIDVKDEYKRRVNVSYEAEQIVKSGDCYDAPYYTRLVEVVDEEDKHIGYQEIMLKRDSQTISKDLLEIKMTAKNTDNKK